MQAYAEGFEILEANHFDIGLHTVSHLWNQGSIVCSCLLELAESALQHDGHINSARGYLKDSGKGRGTVQQTIDTNVSTPVITISLLERFHPRQQESVTASQGGRGSAQRVRGKNS